MSRRSTPTLKRRPPALKPKRRFILYCEGANTEPSYFRALQRALKTVLVEIEPLGGIGVPYTIAKEALKRAKELGLIGRGRKKLNSFEAHDELWAVFDRDSHPKHEEAVALCVENNISLARSNPCFEIWLLLHCEDFQKPDGRQAVQDRLRQIRPEYDPRNGKTVNCQELILQIEAAEKRAERQLMLRAAEGTPYGAPSTTVFLLTCTIRKAAAEVGYLD